MTTRSGTNPRQTMSGGEAIVRTAVNNGIDTFFGIPGVQIYPLFDAMHRIADEIPLNTIISRHEQGAAYMAFGAAKSTGKPAAFTVVPGPGVLNASAALCTAMASNSPVLCLTGQIPSTFLGSGRGHLHELRDQKGLLQSLIKSAERIDTPAGAPGLVNDAFRQMLTGRQGPTAVEMCWDVMASEGDVELLPPAVIPAAPAADPDQVDAAARKLALAKNVMIMVGQGAQHAPKEVLAIAELLNAPVTAQRSGRGVVPADHELSVSSVAAWELWQDTDVLLAIGSRLELQMMRWIPGNARHRKLPGRSLIRIDIDPKEMDRIDADIGVIADAKTAGAQLAEALEKYCKPDKSKRERIARASINAYEQIKAIQPQVDYLNVIRDVLPRDGFYVDEVCQTGFVSWLHFPVYRPRTFITPAYQGTLGYGFNTAIGVKVANPDKAVISINGDGGFMFGVQELATCAQYNIGLVSLVFNNQSFGNVRRDQQNLYAGRITGADLQNPDFVRLSESFGVEAHRVKTPAELKPVLERAIDDDKPVVIEVLSERGSETSPWSLLHPAG